ncbi:MULTISPECIES: TonB-dependent receptor [Pseudoalteromonas]|jgi:iron complex outermembrane receptor protein|uniref:TonB-dependent receptor n=1 Tax=Pseudoalteromonas TaxID=53246 RepID=UPI0000EABB8E|nr:MULTISPECIES: TonB-dependent receptor [Pseudoalteromonas]EAW28400.1 putative TonB-dependent receptor protein [Alteromonadales bacterium TW-7]MBL1385566.1 TonB-dependent receptor [Colwellia sp.]ATG58049.1 TonB-dependent receptor [Pseudoalteromonas marina]MCK8121649.1 TonB-dependent receptor [Pseudoalteromonas sp. 2CM32C]TMS80871.1 TonB-dependent receptor [Pseudoalteromonas sp. S554]
MSMFKPSILTLALAAAGITSFAATAAEEKQLKNDDVEVIEVKGFRGSIVESINTKRFSPEVVESISAEDIGKLPDSSIAESIARLPGLTAQRLDGRASRVSVRGFSENESATTFNGREQVSIGDNRGVEFDLYPSEIMSGVTVYKTPSASIEAEGIAGVIDMQTVKPLSKGERVIMFNGQLEQTGFGKLNPDGDDQGYRGTVSYIDQFADDTIGVAFALNTMSSPNQEKRWNSWGYPEFTTEDGQSYSILGGAKPYVRSSTLERDSAMLVLEAAPTDKLNMTFDALYIDFSDEQILRGIEIPFAWGQGSISSDSTTVDAETGFITSAVTEGQRVVVRNDHQERKAELTQFGFNAKYDINDSWSTEFDISRSEVERQLWSIESYSGTGRGDANGVADNIGYMLDGGNTGAQFSHELDYSDYNLIQLGGPLSWGGSKALNDKYGLTDTPFQNTAQDGFINAPEVNDELTTLKLAATKILDNEYVNAVKFGMSYRDREKSKLSEGYFLTLKDFSLSNPGMVSVPEQYRLGSASLDFIGMGDMIAYDTRALINDGYYDLLQESLTDQKHKTQSWTVQEKVTAFFVQADINAEIGSIPVTGNVGVRYVKTEQSSQGSAANTVDGLVVVTPTDVSHDYSHVLPSINLSFAIDEEQTLRFGAAKTISRALLNDMNASINASYGQQPDDNGNFWSISGGNPKLEPKEATGFDISYENYFNAEGYFSAAVFYKDINQWIFDGTYAVDMSGVANPATGEIPATSSGTGNGKVNGGGGDLWGYELSLALPFNVFHSSLDGFGLIASHTGIEQDVEDQNGNEYELVGLSDQIDSLTVYYERNGFQARTSMRKRSDFKGNVNGLGLAATQVDIKGETIWDAQLGFDFGEAGVDSLDGLNVTFQVQNITEEPFTTLSGDNALQVRDYQDYGRTFLLGFSYKL